MDRTAFILTIMIVLFIAFMLGWLTHWLLHRFARVADGDLAELDNLAKSLHEAEEMRDQAILYMEQREGELNQKITHAEAELRAAKEGLRDARHEADDMRAYIERMHASS